MLISLNWLKEKKNNTMFYLLQIDKLVTKIEVIDSGYSQHISSNRKIFSSYTSVQGGEVFMGNSVTSKVIGEGTIQFRSHDGCITTLQGVHHVPKSSYNLISLGALYRKGFYFSSKDNLKKVSKESHVMFKAERVGNVYMLRNLGVRVGGLQLSSASKVVVVK